MGKATEAAAALRAQLAEAEKAAKAERAAERRAEDARIREENIAKTDAFREETYEAIAGDYSDYIGISTSYDGGLNLEIASWASTQSSISLSKTEAGKLRDALNELLG